MRALPAPLKRQIAAFAFVYRRHIPDVFAPSRLTTSARSTASCRSGIDALSDAVRQFVTEERPRRAAG
jgi:hypothetical protein